VRSAFFMRGIFVRSAFFMRGKCHIFALACVAATKGLCSALHRAAQRCKRSTSP
jgi:hypothetical protein